MGNFHFQPPTSNGQWPIARVVRGVCSVEVRRGHWAIGYLQGWGMGDGRMGEGREGFGIGGWREPGDLSLVDLLLDILSSCQLPGAQLPSCLRSQT